jgi:signal transduction histidine kinase
MVLSDQMVAALDACTARTGHPSEPSIRYLRHAHLAAVRRRRRRRVRRHRLPRLPGPAAGCAPALRLARVSVAPSDQPASPSRGPQAAPSRSHRRRGRNGQPRRAHLRRREYVKCGSLEDKVEYLLRRDQDAQRRANELDARLDRLEAESTERLAELRGKMETHVAHELSTALEAYRPLRVAGTIALVIGLVCVTVATFVG